MTRPSLTSQPSMSRLRLALGLLVALAIPSVAEAQRVTPPAPQLHGTDAPPPATAPTVQAHETARVARARGFFEQGMAAYQANDFGRAAQLLTRADEVLSSPELAFNIAYCYQRMSEPARAIRYYERFLQTGSPTDAVRADVQARIAAMQALVTRQRELTMTLPPSTDAVARDASAFFESGRQMFQRRRYPAALQAFSAAAAAFQALDQDVPELVYNLAVTCERMQQLDDAADYYDEYLRQRPNDPDAARIRALVTRYRSRQRGR